MLCGLHQRHGLGPRCRAGRGVLAGSLQSGMPFSLRATGWHGARLVRSSPQAGYSAALRPDGDRAAFRGQGGVGTKGVPARFRRAAPRRTKGLLARSVRDGSPPGRRRLRLAFGSVHDSPEGDAQRTPNWRTIGQNQSSLANQHRNGVFLVHRGAGQTEWVSQGERLSELR
jgi:hypothetical protein